LAEIDKQKEVIGYLKTAFFFFLGTLFGLIAYIFNNFESLNNVKLIILNIAIVLNLVIIVFIAIKSKKELDKLKDL
jgi:hypothetical protein